MPAAAGTRTDVADHSCHLSLTDQVLAHMRFGTIVTDSSNIDCAVVARMVVILWEESMRIRLVVDVLTVTNGHGMSLHHAGGPSQAIIPRQD